MINMNPTPVPSIEDPEDWQDSQMTGNDQSDEDSQMYDTVDACEQQQQQQQQQQDGVKPTSQLRPCSGERFLDSQEMQEWLSATAIVIDEQTIFTTTEVSAVYVEDSVADQEPAEEDDDHASTILAPASNRSRPRSATTTTSTTDFSIADGQGRAHAMNDGTDDGYETDINAGAAAGLIDDNDDNDDYDNDFAAPGRTESDRSSSEDVGEFLHLTLYGYDSTTVVELEAWSARYNIPPRIARELRWILRNNEHTGAKPENGGSIFMEDEEDVYQQQQQQQV